MSLRIQTRRKVPQAVRKRKRARWRRPRRTFLPEQCRPRDHTACEAFSSEGYRLCVTAAAAWMVHGVNSGRTTLQRATPRLPTSKQRGVMKALLTQLVCMWMWIAGTVWQSPEVTGVKLDRSVT